MNQRLKDTLKLEEMEFGTKLLQGRQLNSPKNGLVNEPVDSTSSKVDDNFVEGTKLQMNKTANNQSPILLLPVEIQEMIFKNLDFTSLINARLVNHSWNIHATPFLSDCSQINLNTFFETDTDASKWTFPKNITPGLIKFIHAPRDYKVNDEEEDMYKMIKKTKISKNTTRWSQLKKFCKKYSNDIIGIKVNGEDYDYRDVVVKHLMSVLIKCEKLQNLQLYRLQHDDNIPKKSRKFKNFFLKPLLSLKFIQLDFYCEWEIVRCEVFLDNILKASENLEELKICIVPMHCYYPDLSNNKKLKRLQIYPESDYVDIPEINYMIERTSGSLETLKFLEPKRIYNVDYINNSDFLSFPSIMSQLKVFINEDLLVFKMDNCSSLLLSCENLQTLKLVSSNTNSKITEEFFKGLPPNFAHLKLENLQIDEIENENLLYTICKTFPNLKKIHISVGEVHISNSVPVELEKFIVNCFEICCFNTKMVDITVRMKVYYELPCLTEILLGCGKLSAGIRTLTFVNSDGFNLKGKEIEKFQNSLLTCGVKMLQLKNFSMNVPAALKIGEFISKNNLPVQFIE